MLDMPFVVGFAPSNNHIFRYHHVCNCTAVYLCLPTSPKYLEPKSEYNTRTIGPNTLVEHSCHGSRSIKPNVLATPLYLQTYHISHGPIKDSAKRRTHQLRRGHIPRSMSTSSCLLSSSDH